MPNLDLPTIASLLTDYLELLDRVDPDLAGEDVSELTEVIDVDVITTTLKQIDACVTERNQDLISDLPKLSDSEFIRIGKLIDDAKYLSDDEKRMRSIIRDELMDNLRDDVNYNGSIISLCETHEIYPGTLLDHIAGIILADD